MKWHESRQERSWGTRRRWHALKREKQSSEKSNNGNSSQFEDPHYHNGKCLRFLFCYQVSSFLQLQLNVSIHIAHPKRSNLDFTTTERPAGGDLDLVTSGHCQRGSWYRLITQHISMTEKKTLIYNSIKNTIPLVYQSVSFLISQDLRPTIHSSNYSNHVSPL